MTKLEVNIALYVQSQPVISDQRKNYVTYW